MSLIQWAIKISIVYNAFIVRKSLQNPLCLKCYNWNIIYDSYVELNGKYCQNSMWELAAVGGWQMERIPSYRKTGPNWNCIPHFSVEELLPPTNLSFKLIEMAALEFPDLSLGLVVFFLFVFFCGSSSLLESFSCYPCPVACLLTLASCQPQKGDNRKCVTLEDSLCCQTVARIPNNPA